MTLTITIAVYFVAMMATSALIALERCIDTRTDYNALKALILILFWPLTLLAVILLAPIKILREKE
jgi:hypothetical protein